MTKSIKEQIRQIDDVAVKKVFVPAWNIDVYVQTLTARQRDQFEIDIQSAQAEGKSPDVRARMAVLCVVDENGAPVFDKSDVEWLAEKSSAALDTIFEQAVSVNGLTEKDLSELEKN